MRRKIKMITVIVVTLSMIISMGTVSFGEELSVTEEPVVEEPVVEEPVVEEPVVEEPVVEEPVVEEPVVEEPIVEEPVVEEPVTEDPVTEDPVVEEPVAEEPVVEEPVVEDAIVGEPTILEPTILEPVFVEETIPRYISLNIGVEPDRENYTNGDLVQYDISIENNGTDPIEDLDVSDDMGVNEKIGYLEAGNRVVITGKYRIDDYNRLESIGNTVDISAVCDGERFSGKVGFVVSVEIPRGSITITNSVKGEAVSNQEFTVLIEGPDNFMSYVELGESDTVTLRNLFIGEYKITPLESMNFRLVNSEEIISLTTSSLNGEVSVEYILENTGWFSDSDSQTINIMEIDSEDIDYGKMELQFSDVDIRSDEIYLDMKPLIVLVEVQETEQPGGETVPAEATPVEDVVSDPVETITEDETTESEPTLESEPLVEQEEANQQIDMEPEAIIPDDPLEESKDEVDTQLLDEGTEEPDTQAQPEEITEPKDSEELPLDSV
ncbi:hypothetical protein [Gudongella sp. DL1XJH-153]|uniref:hypothetical protein n=1 Tax=Gudongella sp. DL1XJH-153 TaxID=3409804 RepID=UPI003BB80739